MMNTIFGGVARCGCDGASAFGSSRSVASAPSALSASRRERDMRRKGGKTRNPSGRCRRIPRGQATASESPASARKRREMCLGVYEVRASLLSKDGGWPHWHPCGRCGHEWIIDDRRRQRGARRNYRVEHQIAAHLRPVQHRRRCEPERYHARGSDERAHSGCPKELPPLVWLTQRTQTRVQTRREISRWLDRREVAEDEKPATQRRVVPPALIAFAQMALHRDHVRFGHGAIDERKMALAEFAAVHGVGLESAGTGLLGVPDRTRRVPNLLLRTANCEPRTNPREALRGFPGVLARSSQFAVFIPVPAL